MTTFAVSYIRRLQHPDPWHLTGGFTAYETSSRKVLPLQQLTAPLKTQNIRIALVSESSPQERLRRQLWRLGPRTLSARPSLRLQPFQARISRQGRDIPGQSPAPELDTGHIERAPRFCYRLTFANSLDSASSE